MTEEKRTEQFNDAMCALRQAEENLNKAVRDIYQAMNQIRAATEENLNKAVRDICQSMNQIRAATQEGPVYYGPMHEESEEKEARS